MSTRLTGNVKAVKKTSCYLEGDDGKEYYVATRVSFSPNPQPFPYCLSLHVFNFIIFLSCNIYTSSKLPYPQIPGFCAIKSQTPQMNVEGYVRGSLKSCQTTQIPSISYRKANSGIP